MICPVCQFNFASIKNGWRFERTEQGNDGIYALQSDVFTPHLLEEMLQHALENQLEEIIIDSFTAEYTPCEGCTLLNLRLRAARHALFEKPEYAQITCYDVF